MRRFFAVIVMLLLSGAALRGEPKDVDLTLPALDVRSAAGARPVPAVLPQGAAPSAAPRPLPNSAVPATPANTMLLQGSTAPPAAPPIQDVTSDSSTRGFGLVGGAGFYFVQPFFSANPAFFTFKTTTNAAGTASLSQTHVTEFNWDFQMAPRVWLGYMLNDAWMIRGQYWRFENDSQALNVTHAVDAGGALSTVGTVGVLPLTSTPLPAGSPGDVLSFGSKLHLNVADIEVVRSAAFDRWNFQGSAGARYADLSQSYDANLVNPGSAALGLAVRVNQQTEHSNFQGFGPVLGGQTTFFLGRGFSLYGTGRGSLLYGHSSQIANQLFLGGVPPEQTFTYTNSRDAFLPIGELELGVGWATRVGRSFWFLRTGFVGQIWGNAGSASIAPGGTPVQSTLFSANALPAGASLSTASSSNLGFLGWTLTVGVQY